jgi:hypothetical protein
MTLRDSLRELDDRHLPAAAGRLRTWIDRAQARRSQARDRLAGWNLAALDTRYAARAPFALLRRRPLLGLAVASAVLVAGVAVAVVREGDATGTQGRGMPTDALPGGDAPEGALLGPRAGDQTSDYVRGATDHLVDAVRTTPNGTRVALVSLMDYRTPEQVDALLSGFPVRRAFLRAKAAGKEAAVLPVDVHGNLVASLRTAYAQTARSRSAAQRSYQGYVDTLRPDSAQDRAFRDLYAAFARSSGIEAREYSHDCACVYSVLVTSTPTLLLSLRARPGVRAVEVAGAGLGVLQVQVQPLLPDVTGVVPRPSVGGYS